MDEQPEKLIPLAVVAELTTFSERTLRDLCNAGVITHLRLGKALALRPQHYEELLENLTRIGSFAGLDGMREEDEAERERVLAQFAREQARNAA